MPELDLFTPSLREAEEEGALSQLIMVGRVVLHALVHIIYMEAMYHTKPFIPTLEGEA